MKKSHIIALTFLPHKSHKLQPLDWSCYSLFKAYYNAACNMWMTNNPGKSISIEDVVELVGTAFPLALTSTNITSGFRGTGIWPCDQHVFQDDEFLAMEVTNRPDPSGIPQQTELDMFPAENTGIQSHSEPSSSDFQDLGALVSAALSPEVVRHHQKRVIQWSGKGEVPGSYWHTSQKRFN